MNHRPSDSPFHCRVASVLCLLAGALAVPAGLAQEGRFGEEVEVLVVEVPVQVLRDGEPVRGLTAEDFEILEGRKRREIVGFDVVDLTLTEGVAAPAATIPVAARRHLLLFFDLSFSRPGSIVRAREAARELVREGLHPSDLVGVATYGRAEGIRIPLGFTSDRGQVELAIESLGLPQLVDSVRDPLGLVLADEADFRNVTGEGSGGGEGGGGGGGVARPGAEEVRELLESMERQTATAQSRNDILALTSSLAGLAGVLDEVDGRKHLVYLSEGFDTSVVLGRGRGSTLEEQQRIQETNEAAMRGEVWDVDSNERFGSTSTQNELTAALQELVRSGVTVQSVDIRGLGAAADSAAEGRAEDGLFLLADETGGELLKDFNNLSEALGRVLERTSVTYLLAFEPGEVEYDGKYHEIKVRLKDGGRGVRVEHRPGYFAPEPYAQQEGLKRRFGTAERVLSGDEGGDIAASLLSAAFPMPGGARSYVPVLLEVDGPSLLAGLQQDTAPTEIYGYAIGEDGAVADFFTQLLSLDVTKVGEALRRTGFKFWGHLELPPGSYSLRVMVRNGATGASAVRVASVEVPEGSESLLLPPFVPEPQGKWLLGREPMPEGKDYPYPFLLGADPIVPAARPRLTANTEERIALAGYGLGGGELGARAELRAADGSTVEGVAIRLEERAAAGPFERLSGVLALGAVPAGAYDLVISVRDEGSGEVHSSMVPVTVG
jgi:VWFA-related protein